MCEVKIQANIKYFTKLICCIMIHATLQMIISSLIVFMFESRIGIVLEILNWSCKAFTYSLTWYFIKTFSFPCKLYFLIQYEKICLNDNANFLENFQKFYKNHEHCLKVVMLILILVFFSGAIISITLHFTDNSTDQYSLEWIGKPSEYLTCFGTDFTISSILLSILVVSLAWYIRGRRRSNINNTQK